MAEETCLATGAIGTGGMTGIEEATGTGIGGDTETETEVDLTPGIATIAGIVLTPFPSP